MTRTRRADTVAVSVLLPDAGQLARVVAGKVNLVAVVLGADGAAIVLDVHGARLPPGPARLTFNAAFGGVLLAGALAVDERGTRFRPNAKGQSYAQRREAFRVTVGLPATIERPGDSVPCRTLNLSIGGVLLQTEAPFAPPYELTVAIDCGDGRAPGDAPRAGLRQRRRHGRTGAQPARRRRAAPGTGLAMTYSLRPGRAPSPWSLTRMTPWTAIALLPFVVAVKLIPPCLAVADRVRRQRGA
jgi:PilZ domain